MYFDTRLSETRVEVLHLLDLHCECEEKNECF